MKKIAVIFAGGKSSRMKQDKALMPFGGYGTLAEYQYRRLSSYFSEVYLSAKNNKFEFNFKLVEDCYNDSSPLVALVSIFETLDTIDEIFVLSVDAPFVSMEVIEKIYVEAEPESSAIVVESTHGLEPLCGIYRRSMLTKAKEFLKADNHRLQALLKEVNVQRVRVEDKALFMNLNYPHEYEEAIRLLP